AVRLSLAGTSTSPVGRVRAWASASGSGFASGEVDEACLFPDGVTGGADTAASRFGLAPALVLALTEEGGDPADDAPAPGGRDALPKGPGRGAGTWSNATPLPGTETTCTGGAAGPLPVAPDVGPANGAPGAAPPATSTQPDPADGTIAAPSRSGNEVGPPTAPQRW